MRGWNGDSAIFGLMSKKIHDGRGFDVFFWGQNYMGPLTPALAAAIRRAVLDPAGAGDTAGPISLRLASLSEIALGIGFYVLALTRLFGRTIATAAGFWMAVGPPVFIRLSVVHRSGLGPEMSFALGSVIFWLAAGVLTTSRPFLDRTVGRFVLGVLGGVGWWMNQTIGFVLLPVAALVLLRGVPVRGLLRTLWPLACGAAVGSAPVWMGRALGWYEPALGPVIPPWRLSGLPGRTVRFLGEDVWRFVGLDGLLPTPFLAVAALFPLALLLLRGARRPGGWLGMEARRHRGLDLVGVVAGFGGAVLVLKVVDPIQDRYLAPVLPAAIALLLVTAAETSNLLRRRIRPGVAALFPAGLALVVAVFLWQRAQDTVASILREPDPRGPLRAIAERGYTVCHAGYDTAYTLQFLSDERVRFVPYHSPDRNRRLSATLRALPGPQCLVEEDGSVREWLPTDAAQEGGPARRRTTER